MPLVAMLDQTVRVDATDVADDLWEGVHRVRPRRVLACRECGWRLHAKVRGDLRFFAHDPQAPVCSTVGESAEHLRLKMLVASAVRRAGWVAELEVPVGTSRRADVLALPPQAGSEPVAFEIQLSRQTAQDTRVRSSDYAGHGVRVVWVVTDVAAIGTSTKPWLGLSDVDDVAEPLAQLGAKETYQRVGVEDRTLMVAVWEHFDRTFELDRVVTGVLAGSLTWEPDVSRWVPTRQREQFAAHQRVAEQTLRTWQEEHKLWELAREQEWKKHDSNYRTWQDRRESTATALASRLEASGHGGVRQEVDISGWYAYAKVLSTTSGLTYAACPVASQVRGGARRKFRELDAVIVADLAEQRRLRNVGVRAVLVDEFVPPPPPLPVRPDGRHASRSVVWALRTLKRCAAEAGLTFTDPTWSPPHAAWLLTVGGDQTVAILDADPQMNATVVTALQSTSWVLVGTELDREVSAPHVSRTVVATNLTSRQLTHPELIDSPPTRPQTAHHASPISSPMARVRRAGPSSNDALADDAQVLERLRRQNAERIAARNAGLCAD